MSVSLCMFPCSKGHSVRAYLVALLPRYYLKDLGRGQEVHGSSLKFLVLGNKSTYQIIRVSLASSYALHLVIELLEWLS